jgi:predicted nucleic-acid-binding protein
MIGIDTNILLRFLTVDDPVQSPTANKLMQSFSAVQPGFISMAVLLETYWVLRRSYRYTREDICTKMASLINASELVIDDEDLVRAALTVARTTTLDLPDIVISLKGKAVGCTTTYTFDKKASELEGMTLLT